MVEMIAAKNIELVGGALALDFTNTAADRGKPGFFEHLKAGGDLADWLEHAGVLQTDAADDLRGNLAARDGEGLLQRALALREAIYRAGERIAHGDVAGQTDLETIRNAAQEAMASAPLVWDGKEYRLDFAAGSLEAAALGPIAWSALEVLSAGGFERLKQCPNCGWLFIDRSKNNSRLWCDMATCGNQNKGRRFRARH
jgi:predicted RNA-binding Zn ribbon-like protein